MKKITKLKVFDFDGTLILTPLPEFGKKAYQDKTGLEWPHQGWWGQPMSLDTSIFEMPVVQSVIDDYKRVKEDETSMVIMLTGRMVKLTDLVKKILDEKELEFDEHHFNRGGSTEVAKIKTMERILDQNPAIIEIELWDDRLEHIPIFQQWGEKLIDDGKIETFKINIVPANRH